MVQGVQQKSPSQATHLPPSWTGVMFTSGLRMRIKSPLKKNFMSLLIEMVEPGALLPTPVRLC